MAKKKLSAGKAKKLTPLVAKFNKLAKLFIRSLNQQIEQKEKELHTIKVMLTDFKPPSQDSSYNSINIQTVDINETTVKRKGEYSFNQKMDWEQDLRNKNRGQII
jgi:hypothetical protein